MRAVPGRLCQESFPLFGSALDGGVLFVLGGGGASRSGVPNGVRAYRGQAQAGWHDLGSELALQLLPLGGGVYALLTVKRLCVLRYDGAFTPVGAVECGGEPRRACLVGELVAVVGDGFAELYEVDRAGPRLLHAHRFESELGGVQCALGVGDRLVVSGKSAAVQLEGCAGGEPKESLLELKPFRFGAPCGEGFYAVRAVPNNATQVQFCSTSGKARHAATLGFPTAQFCVAGELLHFCTPKGRLLVYTAGLRRLLSRQTAVQAMVTHLAATDAEAVVVAVDCFQPLRLVRKAVCDRTLALCLAAATLLVSFLYMLLM